VTDIKVFISWSGELSKNVAFVLRDWIPQIIHTAEAFVSTRDIVKGSTWFNSIALELRSCDYGILCLTNENTKEPWLNFEAGAIFSKFEETRVCPFLYNIEPNEIDEPFQQLQVTFPSKEEVFGLISALNKIANELNNERLNKEFNDHWPDLEQSLNNINFKKIKAENKKELNTISSTTVALKDPVFQQNQLKKIQATEILWKEVLNARESSQTIFSFFYAISEEEYASALTKPFFQTLLKDFSGLEILKKINSNSNNVEIYKPYISDYLWRLYLEYKTFIGRNAFLFGEGIRRKNIIDWRRDTSHFPQMSDKFHYFFRYRFFQHLFLLF